MNRKFSTVALVLVLALSLALVGCGAAAPAPVATAEPNTDVAGQLEDGMREIAIGKGFSEVSLNVNRGEELMITYFGESNDVSLAVPGYEAVASSDTGLVDLYVKAKVEGDFEITATDGGETETGVLVVKPFENQAVFKSVGPEEFEAAMTGDYFLLDVRTPEEYEQVHIDGATQISVYELEARFSEIEQYKETPVLVYCKSGNRSIVASQILIENGFMNVTNLEGGISGWLYYQDSK